MYSSGSETESKLTGRRILINPVELKPNETVSDKVWDKLISLPSQILPKRISKPIKRLTLLAHELAQDGFRIDAGKLAHTEMHKVLDKAQEQFSKEIALARSDIKTVEGVTLRASISIPNGVFNQSAIEKKYVIEKQKLFAKSELALIDPQRFQEMAKTALSVLSPPTNKHNTRPKKTLVTRLYQSLARHAFLPNLLKLISPQASDFQRTAYTSSTP